MDRIPLSNMPMLLCGCMQWFGDGTESWERSERVTQIAGTAGA